MVFVDAAPGGHRRRLWLFGYRVRHERSGGRERRRCLGPLIAGTLVPDTSVVVARLVGCSPRRPRWSRHSPTGTATDLGFAGIHRIYLGFTFSGILWLLTGGLLGIGQLLDLILIPGLVDKANRHD
jgi:TM2 domain-containing protein